MRARAYRESRANAVETGVAADHTMAIFAIPLILLTTGMETNVALVHRMTARRQAES